MEYIYLDWNVIQYMKNSTANDQINGKEFAELVNRLSIKYLFPYSEGHLRDLASSFTPENSKYIKEDLEYINGLSKGYVLGLDERENIIPISDVNIDSFFNDIVTRTEEERRILAESDFKVIGENYDIDMSKVAKDNPLRSYLEASNGVLGSSTMNNFFVDMANNIDDPACYKTFRGQICELKNKFNTPNTLIDQQSEYFKGLIPLLDFLIENDLQVIENNFNEILKSFLSIDGRDIGSLTLGNKIQHIYSLLDFNQNFRDRINKKNKPANMLCDIKNLHFASRAKYYITEDKAAYKKASFVTKVLSLKVKVINMSEFMNKFV